MNQPIQRRFLLQRLQMGASTVAEKLSQSQSLKKLRPKKHTWSLKLKQSKMTQPLALNKIHMDRSPGEEGETGRILGAHVFRGPSLVPGGLPFPSPAEAFICGEMQNRHNCWDEAKI